MIGNCTEFESIPQQLLIKRYKTDQDVLYKDLQLLTTAFNRVISAAVEGGNDVLVRIGSLEIQFNPEIQTAITYKPEKL